MKTDNYLTLCLEQATNSPLRYRHGCIIVRGGKVIGQGFNDVRPGFDGGALKSGRLPVRALDGAALAELKKKHKVKRQSKDPNEKNTKTFVPFETINGGMKLSNNPLSMHSEMMAIHSALAASSTMASSAMSYQKPHFKLSGDSKRKARLRQDAIKSYVETDGELKALHLNRAELSIAFQLKKTACETEECAGRTLKNHHHPHNHGKDHKTVLQYNKRRQYERKLSVHDASTSPHYTGSGDESARDGDSFTSTTTQNPEISQHKFTQKGGTPVTSQPMLIPHRHTGQGSGGISNRTKHPRLHGADLYVARLGWRPSSSDSCTDCCNPSDVPPIDDRIPQSGSLHDELRNPQPRQTKVPITTTEEEKQPSVLSSRPCYRCVSYMHSVGIKRVFWTTDTGEWECAKVRDMVDALDNFGAEGAGDLAAALGNVFVTKHEVLMLRRTMGDL